MVFLLWMPKIATEHLDEVTQQIKHLLKGANIFAVLFMSHTLLHSV